MLLYHARPIARLGLLRPFNALTVGLVIAGLMLLGSGTARSQAADNCLTFTDTSFKVCDRFMDYWKANGGLTQQGLPISDVFEEKNADPPSGDGKVHRVQYFQRARFEEHTENAAPYDVLLGLLGTEQFKAKYTQVAAPQPQPVPCQYFKETDLNVCGRFLEYWNSNGGLTQQGLPVSGVMNEQNAPPPAGDGKTHRVQYFQRARFEEHTENQAPYDVLLGLLGTEQYATRYQKPAPVSSPTPAPSPTPSPTSAPAPTGPTCKDLPPNVNAGTLLRCGPAGMVVVVGASMQKGENVLITPFSPTGVQFESDTIAADKDSGEVNAYIDTRPDFPRGIWSFKLLGKTSGITGTAYVFLDTPVTKPTIIAQPNPAHYTDNIAVISVGWPPNAYVRVTLVTPEKQVFQEKVRTGSGGGFTDTLKVNPDIPAKYRAPGKWVWTEAIINGDNTFISVDLQITE